MLTSMTMLDCISEGMSAIGRASLQGGAVLLVVWVVNRLWTRMPASARVWMWRIAYIKLLVSLCWAGVVALPFQTAPKCRIYSSGVSLSAHSPVKPGLPNAISPTTGQQPGIKMPNMSSARADTRAGKTLSQLQRVKLSNYSWALFILWVLGAGFGIVRLLFGRGYVYRLRQMCRPVEQGEIHTAIADLSQRMGIRRKPALLTGVYVNPMLLGVLRPAIVLPAEQIEEGNVKSLRMVLAHELAHLLRRDLLWNWLPMLAETLFFFHPLVWVAAREGQLAQEVACDELALHSTESASVDYARVLVDAAARSIDSPRLASAAVGVSESFDTLKRRLYAMRSNRGLTRTRLMIVGMVVVILGTALFTWQAVPHPLAHGKDGVRLSAVVVSPDGRHVAVKYTEDITRWKRGGVSGGDVRYNETIEIRQFPSGRFEYGLEVKNTAGVPSIAFSSDSRSLFLSRYATSWNPYHHPANPFYRFDLNSGRMREVMTDVYEFWINQNSNTLWTNVAGRCVNDGHESHTYLVQRDLRAGKELRRLPVLCGSIRAVSPDGTRAVTNCYSYILAPDRRVTGCKDVSLNVWDLTRGKQLVKLEGTGRWPSYAVAFSPDGSLFAASEQDENDLRPLPVNVWDVKSGKIVCTLTGNKNNVREIAFSPKGSKVAGVDYDGQVILWDIAKTSSDWSWRGGEVSNISFTPDGKEIIAGSNRNIEAPSEPLKHAPDSLTILDVKTGLPVRIIKL